MIYYLNGVVADKQLDQIVIDVSGVGYGLIVSPSDANGLSSGQKTKLFIYEHIKEDSFVLYGFSNLNLKQLFVQLLSVKNVGPKVAMAILNLGSETDVKSAIASGDVKLLQSAKGVGKRAAEQIIVELRDKVGLTSSEAAENIVSRSAVEKEDEALQALLALGYTEFDAQRALSGVEQDLSTEQRITAALKGGN